VGGTIINIAGIGAPLKSAGAICISAGNAAIVVMSQALGSASHRDNIRVVTINPGPVETERLDNLVARSLRSRKSFSSRYKASSVRIEPSTVVYARLSYRR
jgi:hypothetical protein